MSKIAVIIAAAGNSSRFKHPTDKKTFITLNSKPVWLHSVDQFQKRRDVKQILVVISEADREEFLARFGANVAVLGIEVVLGGAERCHSIENALAKVDPACDLVLIHQCSRCIRTRSQCKTTSSPT